MHVKDTIGIEQNVTLWANWRYRRIQLHRTDLQEVSSFIWIKLKSYFQGKFPPPSKMPSRTPVPITQYLDDVRLEKTIFG